MHISKAREAKRKESLEAIRIRIQEPDHNLIATDMRLDKRFIMEGMRDLIITPYLKKIS